MAATHRNSLLDEASNWIAKMSTLGLEYQSVVATAHEMPDQTDETQKHKRRLSRRFAQYRLAIPPLVQALQDHGYSEVAASLDSLFSAVAQVVNLVAVSIGVDECEVLDVDVASEQQRAEDAVEQATTPADHGVSSSG